ncbi:hypothetical protein BD410DRAFT_902188 [Rickenella mellea]|uniref:GPI-anchor transamidase n=1 Tax=Rickenella mellea TaxID=50990 RepID=A0A4Y7PKY5_9AGAM|nr:hypothetical protein BD410DRAFT_902188 [Rickenella mellea]
MLLLFPSLTRCWLRLVPFLFLLCTLCVNYAQADSAHEDAARSFFADKRSAHTNNWAVLVCASRYWFNYRHMANALGMYRTVKRLGIPDSNIILMLPDDMACNARNSFPGSVYAASGRRLDLYGDNIEVDYRGYEVTVENFIRLLTGRMDNAVPRSKRLLTDARSNVFVYMTGHGGNEFLKFQDNEEISAFDIADAFEQMWQKKRYNELFFMIDTCQANTMYSKIYSPNILATGSSELDESSLSHENDNDIGVAVIDSYTHHVLQFMEGINKTSHASMQDFFNTYDYDKIRSHAGVRDDLFKRALSDTRVTNFFGGVAQVEILGPSPLDDVSDPTEQGSMSANRPAEAVLGDDSVAARAGSLSSPTHASGASPKDEYLGTENLWDDEGHEDEPAPARWGVLRAWTGVALLGALLGSVAVR